MTESKPSVLPESLNINPTSPLPQPSKDGPRAEFRAAESGLKPAAVVEQKATTSFDVDLHEPRAGDSYQTISREFYNDLRYSRALAEFNGGKALRANVPVEVPPIHILKKRYPSLIDAPTSSKISPVEWRSERAKDADPAPAVSRSGATTFTVPAGGMTMRAVSRQILGTENRWREIYDLNPQFAPDSVPAGVQLKLPAGAALSK